MPNPDVMDSDRYLRILKSEELAQRVGRIVRYAGHIIEADGPDAFIGELCHIYSPRTDATMEAEVIGLNQGRTLLFPYGGMDGISQSCEVFATGKKATAAVGKRFLGRIINGYGQAIDAGPSLLADTQYDFYPQPLNPLQRMPITQSLSSGVRVIDSLLTLGVGQKIGLFAGSGVGKTSLLAQILRGSSATINVVALIGERGREVRDFVQLIRERGLLERTVVVAATSDQPAVARLRATWLATALCEYYRDLGQHVLLVMDSVTRFAMAGREVGLAVGEPPTARGYTPSVFTALTRLVERCGGVVGKGSITGIYTVLVEGDDMNEPIADTMRATLDGHIVLTRDLAQRRHFPAVDVLHSVSRAMSGIASANQQQTVALALKIIAYHERYREMIALGVYQRGSNAELDLICDHMPQILAFLQQGREECTVKQDADGKLANILAPLRNLRLD